MQMVYAVTSIESYRAKAKFTNVRPAPVINSYISRYSFCSPAIICLFIPAAVKITSTNAEAKTEAVMVGRWINVYHKRYRDIIGGKFVF